MWITFRNESGGLLEMKDGLLEMKLEDF